MVVTRPERQAERFCQSVAALGGAPIRLPALEIVPVKSAAAIDQERDIVIYTSPNAVTCGKAFAAAGTRLMAVGKRTAASLVAAGYANVDVPDGEPNSENLLALPQLQAVSGARILIVKGQEGRRTLVMTLATRGARVETAEVYRRAPPTVDDRAISRLFAEPACTVLAFTSGDIARNLVKMVDPARRDRLLRLPLVVGSLRIGRIANELGFRHPPEVADSPADAPMLDAVCRLVARLKR